MDRILHAMSVFTHVARTGSFTAALVECHAEYSEVDLRLDIGGRPEGMIDNGVDCAIVVGKLADSSLRSRRIGSFQTLTVASLGYLARRDVSQDIEALRGHDIIHYSSRRFGPSRQPRFPVDGSEVRRKPPERICIGDAEAVIRYSARGFGIAQVCRDMSASRRRVGSLIEILYEHRSRPLPVTARYSDHRHTPMSVRTFIDWVSARRQGVGVVHPLPTLQQAEIDRRPVSSSQPTAAAIGDVSPIHAV
jgi:LysR family transcriptional regulator for bpeEF and oprC